jgi:YidC/Oxa1 family membrane protein insertase
MLSTIAKPFGLLLMWLYEVFNNYGIAVIIFALIVKLILLPFMAKSKRSMMRMTRFQPKLKELEKKFANDKEKYNAEVAKLYKEEGVNPMSGCLWSLIPFPILLALYQAIRYPLTIMMGVAAEQLAEGGAIYELLQQLGFSSSISSAYEQIAQTQFISANWDKFSALGVEKLQQIDYSFLGLDLGAQPTFKLWAVDWSTANKWQVIGLFLIPIVSAVLTYLSTYISSKMSGQDMSTNKSMMIMMPLVSLWIGFAMPAALGVYWIASYVFSIIQDVVLTIRYKRILDIEDAENIAKRKAREAELEAKRAETERLKAENATVVNPNTSRRKKQVAERQAAAEKTAEWEKQHSKAEPKDEEPSREGNRAYARGRAYDPNRYAAEAAEAEAEAEEKTEEPAENADEPETVIESADIDTEAETDMEDAEVGDDDDNDADDDTSEDE